MKIWHLRWWKFPRAQPTSTYGRMDIMARRTMTTTSVLSLSALFCLSSLSFLWYYWENYFKFFFGMVPKLLRKLSSSACGWRNFPAERALPSVCLPYPNTAAGLHYRILRKWSRCWTSQRYRPTQVHAILTTNLNMRKKEKTNLFANTSAPSHALNCFVRHLCFLWNFKL